MFTDEERATIEQARVILWGYDTGDLDPGSYMMGWRHGVVEIYMFAAVDALDRALWHDSNLAKHSAAPA